MVRLRLIGLCCLLALGVSTTWAASALSKYLLPDQRFKDWSVLEASCTDTALSQMWRQSLSNLPKGMTGYLTVIYRVSVADSAAQATDEAHKLSLKDQFSDYVAKGYTVTSDAWPAFQMNGTIFSIHGLAHTSDKARSQGAEIYNLAFAREDRLVWLQVRQSGTAEDLNVIDRAMKKANGKALAEDLAAYIVAQWAIPEKTETPPAPEKTEVVIDPKSTQPAPVNPAPATPPATETPAATTPPATEAAPPAKEATPPATEAAPPATTTPPATETTPPATTAPPVTPPAANPPATAPAQPPTPDAPDVPRWKAENDLLSLVLPAGWKVTPKAPYTFTGLPDVTVYLYPFEPYKTDAQRDRMLKSFVANQQDIAVKNFTQAPFTPDGSVGVMVSYTNVAHDTIYAYYFAKSGRLWQMLVNLPGDGTPVPAVIQSMVESLRVQ